MANCSNCKKPIGDVRMPTSCLCSSHDLRKRITELMHVVGATHRLYEHMLDFKHPQKSMMVEISELLQFHCPDLKARQLNTEDTQNANN